MIRFSLQDEIEKAETSTMEGGGARGEERGKLIYFHFLKISSPRKKASPSIDIEYHPH